MDQHTQQIKEQFASKFKLTLYQYNKLASSCTTEELVTLLELARSTQHRAPFRAAMYHKLEAWFHADIPGRPPFTQAQFQRLKPNWPIRWTFPQYESLEVV